MSDQPSLLDQFRRTSYKPLLRFAVLVDNYDLSSSPGEHDRIVGRRWDTGEPVEIILRDSDVAERKTIRDFYYDENPDAPVTTPIGGIVMVENAYLDRKVEAKTDGARVYNSLWLVRISESVEKGFPITDRHSLIRVGSPRLRNMHDPSAGHKVSITIQQTDRTMQVHSREELDREVLNALDPEIAAKDRDAWKRSSGLGVGVRLVERNTGDNRLFELYGGYYTPPGKEFSERKGREQVAGDLARNASWQTARKVVDQALVDPNYIVQIVPMTVVPVARKTAQEHANNPKGRRRLFPSEIQVNESSINAFVPGVVCVIRSRKNGFLSAVYAKPSNTHPIKSLSGIPTPAELVAHEQATRELTERTQNLIAQNAHQSQQAAAAPAPTPAPAPQPAMPAQQDTPVTIAPAGNGYLKATLVDRQEALAIAQQMAARVHQNAIIFETHKLPVFNELAESRGFAIEIQSREAKPAPQTQEQPAPPTPATDSQPTPDTAPEPAAIEPAEPLTAEPPAMDEPEFGGSEPVEAPTEQEQPEPGPGFSLSMLDFEDVDIDAALQEAYSSPRKTPTPSR